MDDEKEITEEKEGEPEQAGDLEEEVLLVDDPDDNTIIEFAEEATSMKQKLVDVTMENQRFKKRMIKAGIDPADMEYVLKMRDQDPQKTIATLKRRYRYAKAMGIESLIPADLFEVKTGAAKMTMTVTKETPGQEIQESFLPDDNVKNDKSKPKKGQATRQEQKKLPDHMAITE